MKVLIAGKDEAWSSRIGHRLIGWGFEVCMVFDGIKALAALQSNQRKIWIAILDFDLDQLEVEEVLIRIRNRSSATYQYCIVSSQRRLSLDDESLLLDAGADVVLQEESLILLQAQLQVARRVMEHQMRQELARDDLWNQANQDALTGLPNRRAIIRALEKQATICSSREQPLGILMIDLDFFKQINDNFGHDGGDLVLKEIASRMKTSLRTGDIVGRFGGEEFLAIIPNCAEEGLARLADRIRLAVHKPVFDDSVIIPVSCSIGAAIFAGNNEDPHKTLQDADKALYVAKETGRNKVITAWERSLSRQQIF